MVIVFILIVGLILRLINLNQSLWLDETVQAITARNSFSYIFSEIVGDFHPPLYHFLMYLWVRVFGSSEVALRMPSVLFGVGTVYVVYKLGKLVKFGKLGITLAILLATAPFHIYYSQEARMYAMGTFLTAGSFYFFLKVLGDDKGWLKDGRGNILGYFLFTLLALYTDYYAFFILLAQIIFVLYKKKFKFLLLVACFLLLYIPWLPMAIAQLKTGFLATQSLPEWGRLVNLSFVKALPLTFIKFSMGRITIFNKALYALVAGVLFLVYGLTVVKGFFKGKKLEITDNQLLITFWLSIPVLFAWLISLFVPNYQPFRLLLVLPAFYLLIAFGIAKIKEKKPKSLAISLVLLVNFCSLAVYYTNPYFHREDWRGVVSFLKQQRETFVILPSGASAWPLKYYDPDNKVNLISVGKGVNTVDKGQLSVISDQLTATGNNKIYYVRYLVPLFDPEEKILKEIESSNYSKIKEISFNQIPVWVYGLTD